MRLSRVITFLLIGILLVQSVFYYPILPDILASHFDAARNPNGWMTKPFFFLFEGLLLLLLLGTFYTIPSLIKNTPEKWINLPNKDYWLAEERREETYTLIGKYNEWFGIALLLLFIFVNQMVFQANINKKPLPSIPMWTILGAFFVFTIIWITLFVGHFKKTK